MSSVRTLRTIEKELRRQSNGARGWQTARPIVGADPITIGWNELLEDVANRGQGAQPRVPAALDQEVVTLARAMRGLPVAWVITDTDGIIRFLGPGACGLLNLPEEQDHVGADLPQLIGLRDETDETDEATAAALSRLLGPIRMLHERRTIDVASRQLHIRITRSRLSGRSGDGDGMA